MAKIMTATHEHVFLRKPVLIEDKIEENTTITGDVLCIQCEMGNMEKVNKDLVVATVGALDIRKIIEIKSLQCKICTYLVINDEHSEIMRNKFI